MYLKNFERGSECTWFDPSVGTGGEFEKRDDEEIEGFCSDTGDVWVAIYSDPDDGTVLVQIDGTVWDLGAPETVVEYGHDDDETHFEIRDDANRFETTHGYWMDDYDWDRMRPEVKMDRMETSHDWTEDVFGAIYELWRDDEMARRFVEDPTTIKKDPLDW